MTFSHLINMEDKYSDTSFMDSKTFFKREKQYTHVKEEETTVLEIDSGAPALEANPTDER